jgi:hypothetical protein
VATPPFFWKLYFLFGFLGGAGGFVSKVATGKKKEKKNPPKKIKRQSDRRRKGGK